MTKKSGFYNVARRLLKERLRGRRVMPIRASVSNILNSYSNYISSVNPHKSRQSRSKEEDEEEHYEHKPSGSGIPFDVKRKKLHGRAAIEM